MGAPKLLLRWRKWTVIEEVISAWSNSVVDTITIVMRSDDKELSVVCQRYECDIVVPRSDPVDMRESIQHGIAHIQARHELKAIDRVFMAPADIPTLTSQVINRLASESVRCSTITVPMYGEQQGHPVVFPANSLKAISGLKENEGIDALIRRSEKQCVILSSEDKPCDIDCKEDYIRMSRHD